MPFSQEEIGELSQHFARADSQGQSGSITMQTTKSITLTDNSNDGHIARLIQLKSTYNVDRPSISWIDDAGRHVTTLLTHYKLIDALGGDIHQALEIKTVASSVGPDPSDFRTRLSIGYNAQRTKFGMPFIDVLELFQGENTFTTGEGVTNFGIDIRAVPQDISWAGASSFKLATFSAQIDATENGFLFIDCNPPYSAGNPAGSFPGNKGATIVFFRNVNLVSASNPSIQIKKGDGTNTSSVSIIAKSGAITTIGPIGINGSAAPAKPTVTGSRAGNAALASALTALASYGFITDSSSA